MAKHDIKIFVTIEGLSEDAQNHVKGRDGVQPGNKRAAGIRREVLEHLEAMSLDLVIDHVSTCCQELPKSERRCPNRPMPIRIRFHGGTTS